MERSSSHRPRAVVAGILAPLAFAPGWGGGSAALAAQWNVQPAVDVGAVRDDNIRLTPGPHETTTGYVAAANLDVERERPTSLAELDIAVVRADYSEGEAEDRTDHRARLNAEQRTSERGTLGLRAEYRRDTVFDSVVLEEGTGDIEDVDVGLSSDTEVQRYYRVIEPEWTWLLTELSSVNVSYRTRDVNFADAQGTGLIDYESDSLSTTYSRRISVQNRFHVTAATSRYRREGGDGESDTLRLLAGMGRDFSETLEGSFAVGVSRTTETVAGEDRSSGLVLRAELRQEGEVSRLHGIFSRDVTPSGIGRALQTDQLRLYWVRGLTPTMDFVLDAWWLQTEVVEGFDPNANRRYYEVSPKLRWQWLANVSVVASYRQRYQKYEAAADSADSSTVFLGLSYRL